jgi:cytosine/adenosine deaminase-related metal-dependent hydrolase
MCGPLPQGEAGLCSITPANGQADQLLIQGLILGKNQTYEGGSVLIDLTQSNGQILCVGCDCEAQASPSTARVVCPDGVISPGLINPHDHLGWTTNPPAVVENNERYEHRHDWRKGKRGHSKISAGPSDNSSEAVLYGELRMLMSGTTSMAGSGSASGLVRNLDRSNDNGGLGSFKADYRTFPLGDSSGSLHSTGCDQYEIDGPGRLNERIYLPHVSEGIDPEARNEFGCLSGESGTDLIAENTSMIHGIGLTPSDIVSVGMDGAKLVWSPRSNIQLYGHTASVVSYAYAGVTIALGTDWVPSGSMNMLRELQCADLLNTTYYGGFFSDEQVWAMATYNGAVSLGVEDQLGRIDTGYIADITVFQRNGKAGYRAVLEANPEDVSLVLRGGKVLYGEQGLVSTLGLGECEDVDVCGRT